MSLVRTTLLLLLHGTVAAVAATALDSASPYFHIRVIDGETGEGVPLVLLRTGNYLELYTDSAGNAAFLEPGMMDMPVFFSILSDGYEYVQQHAVDAPAAAPTAHRS